MTFERSAKGQGNRAIFYEVDLTCYVEGEDEADSGDDVYFWHIVFSTLRPNLTIKFLSRGGKPQLETLAREMIANDVPNLIVAMDADYSRFFDGRIIDHERVFYTHGYSWESDVFSPQVDEKAYCDIARKPQIPPAAAAMQREKWDKLSRALGRLMRADFFAFRCGGSIVEALKPGRYIGKFEDGFPYIKAAETLSCIMQFNTDTKPRVPKPCTHPPTEVFRYTKGRLLSMASRLIALASVRQFEGAKGVTDAHHKFICLGIFRERLRHPSEADPIATFHKAQVERLAA